MQNKGVVRRAYDLFSQEAGQLFAPDAVWHFPGQNALSGDYKGPEAIVNELLPKFPALSNSTFRATLLDVADGDKYTLAVQHSQAERDGQSIDHIVCHMFTLKDGLIREVRTCPYDGRAQDAFWH